MTFDVVALQGFTARMWEFYLLCWTAFRSWVRFEPLTAPAGSFVGRVPVAHRDADDEWADELAAGLVPVVVDPLTDSMEHFEELLDSPIFEAVRDAWAQQHSGEYMMIRTLESV